MLEPQCLTIISASTVCYRESFTFLLPFPDIWTIPFLCVYFYTKFHVNLPQLTLFIQRNHPSPRTFVTFRNKLIFYDEDLWAQNKPPKLEDHPLSAFHGCLLNIFAATLHIWKASLPSANPRTYHAVVTRDPTYMDPLRHRNKYKLVSHACGYVLLYS
jgi:hypothetical protein